MWLKTGRIFLLVRRFFKGIEPTSREWKVTVRDSHKDLGLKAATCAHLEGPAHTTLAGATRACFLCFSGMLQPDALSKNLPARPVGTD